MVSISLLLYEECSSSFLAPSVWNNLPNEGTKTLHQFKCLINIKLRNAFSTKSDRKIAISIFTTRLLSSQQLMDFFFNFSYGSFFLFFFDILRYLSLPIFKLLGQHCKGDNLMYAVLSLTLLKILHRKKILFNVVFT